MHGRVLDDVSSNKRLSNIGYSFFGIIVSSVPMPEEITFKQNLRIFIASLFAALIQTLVFVLVLCPLGIVYMFGLLISTGLSMWRIIQRDYAAALDTDPNKKNLRPALNVLYSLALLQGGLFLYRAIFYTKGKAIAKYVAIEHDLDQEALPAITNYFRETKVGLEKDPSFTREWNLVPYAVGMLESRSTDRYLSGARLLDSLLTRRRVDNNEVKLLLLGSPSTGYVIQKLLWTLDSTKPYGEEAREPAANIVKFLAGDLYLEQFPRGLRNIVSLLDDSNPKLTLWGLKILSKLAADEDNRRAMSDMPSLLPKTVATVNIQRHQSIGGNKEEHRAWDKQAWPALRLVAKLMDSPEESDANLRLRQGISKAISASTMENIIQCNMCDILNKKSARKILKGLLPGDEASRKDTIVSKMNKHEVVVQIPPAAEIEEVGC